MRRALILAVVLVPLALLLDQWTYQHVVYLTIYDSDGGRFLRILGFWPTWGIFALALWLHERGHVAHAARRALLIGGSPAVSGIADELVKLIVRRERPTVADGAYVFRSFSERPFASNGLAFPSSHAAVAFGAAFMLAHLFPRARGVWFTLASLLALTRVLARAHYLSDVAGAVFLAFATTALLWRRFGESYFLRSA